MKSRFQQATFNTIAIICFFTSLMYTGPVLAGNTTIPGEVTTPYPTIIHLAVEWTIEGDDNLNATCDVKYREVVSDPYQIVAWHDAMPLRRIPAGESVGTTPVFTWTNRLSGSIFDLKPDTEYEIHLILKDPDGGEAEKTVKARTRPVPKAAVNAPTRNVNPATIDDVKPGEIGLLADGDYGHFVAKIDGEPGKPVIYRAAGKAAKFTHVSLAGRKHVYIEGLVIRTDTLDSHKNHQTGVNLLGAEDCVVRRCDIAGVFGIRASAKPGAKNCYIADNTVVGITPWTNEAMGANGQNIGEGIEITGPGNVICFNYVSNFRDCISFMEDTYTCEQHCIDVYNNDISVGSDDAIEADFAMSNCRIMRNRIVNSFVGLSSQPGLGGPTYFIRNVMYNLTYVPFKLHRRSFGDVILHNTVIKSGDGLVCFAAFDYAYFRNNLTIGGPTGGKKWGGYGGGDGQAVNLQPGKHSDIDYDAVGAWHVPFSGKIGDHNFSSVEEMRKGFHETHGIEVSMDVFNHVTFPDKPETLYLPPDLRPKTGAVVVDSGVIIPNVNDSYTGKAPDIGACEEGEPLPMYGPRPEGIDESIITTSNCADASTKKALSGVDKGKIEVIIKKELSKDPSGHNTDWFGTMPLAGLLSWYNLGYYPEVKEYVTKWLDYHHETNKVISDEEFHNRTSAIRCTVYRGYTLLFAAYCGYPGVNFVCGPLYQLTGNEMARQVCKDMGDFILHKMPRNELGFLQQDDVNSGVTIPDAAYFFIPALFIAAKAWDKEVLAGDAAAKIIQDQLYADGCDQLKKFTDLLLDKDKKITKTVCWNGKLGETFWTRANGWLLWTIVDALDHIDKDSEIYIYACNALDIMAQGILKYQDQSGALHLLVDETDTPLESSGTIMAAYGIHKAVRNGWINKKYLDIADRAWNYIDTMLDFEGNLAWCYSGWADPAEKRELDSFGPLKSVTGMLITTSAEFEKPIPSQ